MCPSVCVCGVRAYVRTCVRACGHIPRGKSTLHSSRPTTVPTAPPPPPPAQERAGLVAAAAREERQPVLQRHNHLVGSGQSEEGDSEVAAGAIAVTENGWLRTLEKPGNQIDVPAHLSRNVYSGGVRELSGSLR